MIFSANSLPGCVFLRMPLPPVLSRLFSNFIRSGMLLQVPTRPDAARDFRFPPGHFAVYSQDVLDEIIIFAIIIVI